MGFFDDMLDEGMGATRRLMDEQGLSYGEAYKRVTNRAPAKVIHDKVRCRYCHGTGDTYFGSHCGGCNGTGWVGGDEAARQAVEFK